MKTLYFEGAGWFDADSSKATNVGNCRIRTAFTNDEGKQIYLEMTSANEYGGKGKPIVNHNVVFRRWLYISHLFYITGGNDDENLSSIPFDWRQVKTIDYTKENIVSWVNEHLNCSFDAMEVLEDMEGYRVFADHDEYNFMEDHTVNPERTAARQAAYNMIDQEYKTHCQDEYSVVNIMSMNDNTITTRCHASDRRLVGKPRIAVVDVWTKEVVYK